MVRMDGTGTSITGTTLVSDIMDRFRSMERSRSTISMGTRRETGKAMSEPPTTSRRRNIAQDFRAVDILEAAGTPAAELIARATVITPDVLSGITQVSRDKELPTGPGHPHWSYVGSAFIRIPAFVL
jgi:hypothetical protein